MHRSLVIFSNIIFICAVTIHNICLVIVLRGVRDPPRPLASRHVDMDGNPPRPLASRHVDMDGNPPRPLASRRVDTGADPPMPLVR